MKRTGRSRVKLRVIASLTGLVCLLGACGDGSDSGATQGVTDDTIVIGSHQPLTGPAAPGYSNISKGAKAYFDHVNAEGGINGRKIEYRYRDDAYNPTQTVTASKELVLEDRIFAMMGGLGTPTHTKVIDFLNAQKVPDLFVGSGCACWDNPRKYSRTFGWQPDYIIEGKILGNHIKHQYPGKKVAYFYQDDDFGNEGVEGLDKALPADSVVSRQSYQPKGTDIAPQVSAIAASKADVVVIFALPAYTALFKLVSLKLNYKPTTVVSSVSADPTNLNTLLKTYAKQVGGNAGSGDLADGIITASYLPPNTETSNSWIKLFRRIHNQYTPKAPFDLNIVYGMSQAYTFAQALQAAGKDLTRDSLVKALEKGGFTGPGLVPLEYSSTSHSGYKGEQIGTIKGSKLALQGTPQVTDNGDGPITSYTTAQPQAPANGIPSKE
ncbi:ABC transporter substrate-binding protein [Streptomyces sp. NPDC051776]|uniref:ABC transporter substrate-binding protein n=1 Tax=Streptomyces sp. NPDC051776 TaxID=3155414 RepID=UPI00343C26AA